MKRFLIVLSLMVLAFLGGYIPMYLRCRNLEQSLEQTQTRLAESQEKLQVAQLQGYLGAVLVQVDEKNFGTAQNLSTEFFDRLQSVVTSVQSGPMRERLNKILQLRDAITSDLSTLNPDTASTLRAMFSDLHKTVSGS